MKNEKQRHIAIIGTGISGLGMAGLLHSHHRIKIYEKNNYMGGHSRTIDVKTSDGPVAVDTGFIVFNKRNYPYLTSLFETLQVPIEKSDMSFGISVRNGQIEYGTRRLGDFFAQKSHVFNPHFLKMIKDIIKFNKKAHEYLACDLKLTVQECLDDLKMGEWFRRYYLLAMAGAIWSAPLASILNFPAQTLIRFFDNHGLLTINRHPQWYTVKDGSRSYIKRLIEPFADSIFLNCGVEKVIRQEKQVLVCDTNGHQESYDEVIFACHADHALQMIDHPSDEEYRILSSFSYQANRVVVHRDITFMPKLKRAWASWVYLSEGADHHNAPISLSYWMNNLQPLKTRTPIFVTLNPSREPPADLLDDEYWFDHPVFDARAIQAQKDMDSIQGKNSFWFCGAYQRYGFHEDGLLSAVKIAEKMGIVPSWK